MKGCLTLIAGSFFLLAASTGMAADTTTTATGTTNWICTTNASSSSVDADKAADKEMANTAKGGTEAFAFAFQHCRDCTKITCDIQK